MRELEVKNLIFLGTETLRMAWRHCGNDEVYNALSLAVAAGGDAFDMIDDEREEE